MAILRQSLILPNMTKDLVPLFIQIFIVRAGSLPAPSGRDAGPNASDAKGITEPVGVISTVRQQLPGLRQSIYGIHKQGGSLVVAYLACRELHGPKVCRERRKGHGLWSSARPLCGRCSGKEPFFEQTGGGTMSFKVACIDHHLAIPAVFANSVKILLKMPIRLQRKKRL